MIEFRKLTTMTRAEAEILVSKCLNGKLINIVILDNVKAVLKVETSGWAAKHPKNPNGTFIDLVQFDLEPPGPRPLVDGVFSENGNCERVWQEFMIFYGFHPYYQNNTFEQEIK